MTCTGGKECKDDFSTINVYVPIPDIVDVAAFTETGLCIPQCSYIRVYFLIEEPHPAKCL